MKELTHYDAAHIYGFASGFLLGLLSEDQAIVVLYGGHKYIVRLNKDNQVVIISSSEFIGCLNDVDEGEIIHINQEDMIN